MAVLDFGAAALVFGVFGLVLCHLARNIAGWPRRLCVAVLTSAMVCSVADMLVQAALRYPVSVPVYRALLVIQDIANPLSMLLFVAYMLHCCGEDYRNSVLLRVLCVLSGCMTAGACVLSIAGEIGPPPDYEVRMGRLHILLFTFSMALLAVTFIALFRRWKKLTNVQRAMFLLSFLSSHSAVMIFVEFLLVYDLIRRHLAKQEESEQQRTRIAIAQMRPHFIYNTLGSIYYFCEQDTQKTKQIIRDFNRYLQSNFTTIAEERPIPFDKELEHTRAYLAVEQACHEGMLFVEFDTPVTFFRVPALTLQPIVENAAKYGLTPDRPPLYVFVTTEDTGNGVQITVEDTGPGFQQSIDNKPHTALNNIRQRLSAMCGGRLTIEPREGGGTKVTMFVPRRKASDK